MPHCQHVAPRRRRIFLAALAITAALRKPAKHCKIGFSAIGRCAPHFRTHSREHSRTHRGKKPPHFRTQQHAYIYIYRYRYICMRLGSGPIFAILKVRFWINFVFLRFVFKPNSKSIQFSVFFWGGGGRGNVKMTVRCWAKMALF